MIEDKADKKPMNVAKKKTERPLPKEALAALEKAQAYLEPFGHESFSSGDLELDKKGAEMLKECAALARKLKD